MEPHAKRGARRRGQALWRGCIADLKWLGMAVPVQSNDAKPERISSCWNQRQRERFFTWQGMIMLCFKPGTESPVMNLRSICPKLR